MVFSGGERVLLQPVLTQGSSRMKPPPSRMLPVTRARKWGHKNHVPARPEGLDIPAGKDTHHVCSCFIGQSKSHGLKVNFKEIQMGTTRTAWRGKGVTNE